LKNFQSSESRRVANVGSRSRSRLATAGLAATAILASSGAAFAGGYTKVVLDTDSRGGAPNTDPHLVNPWGLTGSLSGTFYVADNKTGLITAYPPSGIPSSFAIEVPNPNNPLKLSTPTALVFNTSNGFRISQSGLTLPATILMVTEDGTIGGWNANVASGHAVLTLDRSFSNSVYKGMATGRVNDRSRLYATDFFNARIDMLNEDFEDIVTPGAFRDPALPPGYAPFGIANVNGNIFVSYALQEGPDNRDDEPGAGHGLIDVFRPDGSFVKRLLSYGELNSPWAMVAAPTNFGQFSNLLLVGNFGDGRILAYNVDNGGYHGPVRDAGGNAIRISGLWALTFLPDETAARDNITEHRLYFTAGPDGEEHGAFGYLHAN
jgi:uncharacterized protein (TIGR03118 family)